MLCVSVCSSSSSCVSCLVISSSSRWRTCSRVVLPIQLALPPPARPVSRPCVQMPSLLNESLVSRPSRIALSAPLDRRSPLLRYTLPSWKIVLSKSRQNSCDDWFPPFPIPILPVQVVTIWRGTDRGVEAQPVEAGWTVAVCLMFLIQVDG